MLRLLCFFLSLNLFSIAWSACPLKDGDLIFIKSQTTQAKLLKVITGSDWTHMGLLFKNKKRWSVIEAVQPVKWTNITSFIKRSKSKHFEVYRPLFTFDPSKVKAFATQQLGKDYDLIFSMDDKRWYCSELAWKAYLSAANEEIGVLEKIKNLKFNNPQVLQEAKRRFELYDLEFKTEDWIESEVITPVQMIRSQRVQKVLDHKDASKLKNCRI